LNLTHALSFRARLLLAMMLVIVSVTGLVLYVAENNLRTNQQRALTEQFQNQLRSFLTVQDLRSGAIAEKCRKLSRSVRLRAALEEKDVDDLYQNALAELQEIFSAYEQPANNAEHSTRASFFRFVDTNGVVLPTGNHPAGEVDSQALESALPELGLALHDNDEQRVAFVQVARGNRPETLRQVVLTKVHGWNGQDLGALVLGFPINQTPAVDGQGAEIKSGIWFNHQFYIADLSSADRHLLAQRVQLATSRNDAGNFTVDLEKGPYLLFYKALNSHLAPAYDVCLYPLATSLRETQALRWKIVVLGMVVLVCGFAASLFLAKKLSKPVDQIVATSVENVTRREKAEKDLHEVNRELEKALSELKATQQQVIQQERLSALGQMAAGIAHDFNNTLMPILGFADVLLQNERMLDDKAEARQCLEMLRTSAKDAASVVSRLREFYRPADSNEEFPVVDLAKLVQQAIALTQPKWRGLTQARGITVRVETIFKGYPIVAGDESALREVLTNLLFNAVDAMPEGGSILLETAIENERAVLRVRDTGTGMTETVRRRCLEPFFSTKGDRGTGLGLSMVYGIVERHRGQLEIESAVGKGTTFIIRLPVAQELPIAQSAGDKIAKSDSGLNVLVVDDEARSREVLMAYLRTDNHSVAMASSGREALEKFRLRPFDLVVMDRAMPEMNGEQTAKFMKQVNQNIPVILLTGFSGQIDADCAKPTAVDVVLNKPITLDALRRGISKVVDAT
jgi:signal transduction histidine kinase/ActR/RegA family two-component response regulator